MKSKKDYQAMFFTGVIFVGTGVVFMTSVNLGLGAAFIGIGGLFMIISSKNKNKWKK